MRYRPYIISLVILVSIHSAFCTDSFCQEIKENIVIGKKTQMYSDILDEWRPLELYLPDDYETSDKPYPVLLVLDGGWRFNYCVSIVDMMSPNYFPRMIVVGLPNTDRSRDLYPLQRSGDKAKNGTEKFLRFMNEELFPYLGKEYRTRDYRILFGHSLGGFFPSIHYSNSLHFLMDTLQPVRALEL